jgi:hypothetical protein
LWAQHGGFFNFLQKPNHLQHPTQLQDITHNWSLKLHSSHLDNILHWKLVCYKATQSVKLTISNIKTYNYKNKWLSATEYLAYLDTKRVSSCDSKVSIVTMLWAEWPGVLLLSTASKPAVQPTQPPSWWIPVMVSQGVKGRGMKLTTPLHLLLMLKWVKLYLSICLLSTDRDYFTFSPKEWSKHTVSY